MPKFLLVILLMLPLVAAADIYQWTDEQGRIHFSDKPIPGAKKRQVTPLKSVENPTYNLENNRLQMRFTEEHGSMRVNGKVNGVPVRFVVDTGATLVIIPPAIATKARMKAESGLTITLKTANGDVPAPLVSIAELDVDGVVQRDVQGAIHRISDDSSLGLLGMSFFDQYTMTIDRDKKIIYLEKK